MGKWTDRLETLNAPVTLPAEPAEAPSAGHGGLLGGASWVSGSPDDHIESIEQLSLSQFAMSGQFCKVHSKVLNEIIVLAADNADLPGFGGTVVYRVAEARLLAGMSPNGVRAYHDVKAFFDGIIERSDPNGTQVDAADLFPEREGENDDVAQ